MAPRHALLKETVSEVNVRSPNINRNRAITVPTKGTEPMWSERMLLNPAILPDESTVPSNLEA